MTNFTLLCHSRPRLLQQTLDSIGDEADLSIDILADEPTHDVAQIALDFIKDRPGGYIGRKRSQGTGAARNAVIGAAGWYRGDYLYLSDDDVYFLRPDWLSVLIRCYEVAWDAGFKIIGAYNHPYHLPIATTAVIEYGVGDFFVVNEVYALALQSMLMKWEVWDKYGPFCKTRVGMVCDSEDVDFTNKIRADGGRIGVISPPLLVNCGVTNSFGEPIPGADLVRQQAPQGVFIE